MHRCYACDAANPERSVFDGGVRLRVPARFTGPPGGVNGGMAAGLLVCPALHAAGATHALATRVVARLHRQVPVERGLLARAGAAEGGYAVSVSDGDDPVISGSVAFARSDAAPLPGTRLGEPPAERAGEMAAVARVITPDRPPFWEETGEHPIPGCFSCGPLNDRGLRIFPRIVEDGVVASDWLPAPEFYDAGLLPQAVIASALDCSSGICMPARYQRELLEEDRFFLLGTFDVRYLLAAPAGGRYRVVATAVLRDGRKFFGMSALVGEDGRSYAMAEATWIVAGITRTEAFGTRKST